ncbi:hypothetical protein CROQUDRAFT_52971 [Cronartium quercuum f. sp. fusiforme G11]|uniref:Brl1/Brr6 domain-containing protein n=1 Tax=Cronartium quercuum f. sp. fusiforme G11 TaxID=708437 RepID=A0A9P6N6K3_9BASI|nr:hypothetical protein CROQUDRAFT_52971 [Cronartium quercuum f. sp. fusiforme G11]
MSVESDDGSGDPESEDDPEDQSPSRSLVRARARSPSKATRNTTHNHLTINGWNPHSAPTTPSSKSKLATETPYILLVYLQLLFNTSLVALALYLVFAFLSTMRVDVNSRLEIQTIQLRQEIEVCANEYRINRCFPVAERTKFIEQHCIEWERCMTQNPTRLSRSKIGAETFAEVMNGFVDVISLKTMIFIITLVTAGIWATNMAMNSYKAKWNPSQHTPYLHPKTSHSAQHASLSWAPPAQEFDPAAIFAAASHHHASTRTDDLPPESPGKRAAK